MMTRYSILICTAALFLPGIISCSSPEKKTAAPHKKPTFTSESRVSRTVAINRPEYEEGFEEPEPALVADAEEEQIAIVDKDAEKTESSRDVAAKEADDRKRRYDERRRKSAKTKDTVIAGNPKDAAARLSAAFGDEEDDLAASLEGIKKRKAGRAAMREGLADIFSDEDEVELGKGVAARILHETPELNDRALWEYVSFVGLTLADRSERSTLTYYFMILDTDDINAFSAPGGFVFITRGAIELCSNEAELAAILSHELAHISLRHSIRSLDKSKYRLMAKDALREMDELLPHDDPEFKRLVEELSAIGDSFYNRTQNPFNRTLEYEADRESLLLLVRTGYNPFAAVALMERMEESSGKVPRHAKALSSHPCAADRITVMKEVIAKEGLRSEGRLNEKRFRLHVK